MSWIFNRFNTYEDPQQWSNFEKLRFLVTKNDLIFTQKYCHFFVKFPTDYGIVTPYWTLPVNLINGLFLRTLHFSDYPIVSTHRNQTMRRGFLMVRYPLKRPLSVELDVAIHLSSTFQRAFFHSSKHFLILAWWMRKRWNHLGFSTLWEPFSANMICGRSLVTASGSCCCAWTLVFQMAFR